MRQRSAAFLVLLIVLSAVPALLPASAADGGGKGDKQEQPKPKAPKKFEGAKEKDVAKACMKMDKALHPEALSAGTYQGKYSAALEAVAPGLATFTVTLDGELKFTADGKGGIKSVEGSMLYTFTGDAPNLPAPAVFDLNATATGKLRYDKGGDERFTVKVDGKGTGHLAAGFDLEGTGFIAPGVQVEDVKTREYDVQEQGSDKLTFVPEQADCHSVSGSLQANMFDAAADGFAQQGTNVAITKEPTFSVTRDPGDKKALNDKLKSFQSTMKKQKLDKPDFTKIMAVLEVYERDFKTQKQCAHPLLTQWLTQVLGEWIPKAGAQADELIARLAAADLDDKASKDAVKQDFKDLKKLLGELAVYRVVGSFLGVELHDTGTRNEAAASVLRKLNSHWVTKGEFELALSTVDAARLLWLGDICHLDVVSVQIDAELAEQLRGGAAAFFAQVVAGLQSSDAKVEDAAEKDRLKALMKKEQVLAAALDGFPRALFRHCTESKQC